MKQLLFLSFTILAVNCLSEEHQWNSFKEKYSKIYKNTDEEERRFTIFQNNLKVINEHNERYQKGETSFYMGVNKFADLTTDEFSSKLLQSKPNKEIKSTIKDLPKYDNPLPNSYDARSTGSVSPIRDQGDCASGYAFTAVGAVESLYYLKTNRSVVLSPQELLDCSRDFGNAGCLAGALYASYDYMVVNGITSESDYPYDAVKGGCRIGNTSRIAYTLEHWTGPIYELALKQMVYNIGPISVCIYASRLHFYEGGIFDDIEGCPNDERYFNHNVLTIGYGSEGGKEFWILKNSWGTDWGEEGYVRILRNPSICGVINGITFINEIRVNTN